MQILHGVSIDTDKEETMGKKEDEPVVYDAIDLSAFVYTENMTSKIATLKSIDEYLAAARDGLVSLWGSVMGCDDEWSGYGHDESEVLLELLVKYIDALDGSGSPVKQMISELDSFETIMSSFETDSAACSIIKGL